jgi:SMI1-KNR4 cell-wall
VALIAVERTEFERRVEAARTHHPRWFDLERDTPVDEARLAAVETALTARLPSDYAWFLGRYGGGSFVFATIFSGDEGSRYYILGNQDEQRPPDTVAFSDNGCGDLFVFPVVDRVCEDSILYVDHETGETSRTDYDGFLDFAERYALHY